MRFATDEELQNWDDLLTSNPDGGNIFQGYELAEHKQLGGWTPRYIRGESIAITAWEKPVFGLGKLWYLPKGPGTPTVTHLAGILPELKAFAREKGVFTVKMEPEILKTDESVEKLAEQGLIKSSPIQPNFSTILVDISPDLETIMASLNQKGRHAIKRAERDGVKAVAVEATDENCRIFYELLVGTAEGRFTIRSYDYLKKFWQRYANNGTGQLFFSYVDDQVVSGVFALRMGTKSMYKDGASVRERPVYGASHLLQWRVIEWAKANGALVHDLCGSTPSDQTKNEQHPFYGIYRFKSSFNKEVTDYVGAYDLVVRPMQSRIWQTVGERAVRRLHRRKYHEDWY